MPVLLNPRHERFAQELANGKSGAEAYIVAGYKPNRHNASTLKQRETVSDRVAEILAARDEIEQQARKLAAERTAVSKEWIIARLRENVERSMQVEAVRDQEGKPIGEYAYQGSVANKALELLGKEIGMFIDRREVGKPGEFADLSPDELAANIERELIAGGVVPEVARAFARSRVETAS